MHAPDRDLEWFHRSSRSATAQAPGKINLSLAVGAADDTGYHDLATVFQAVSVYETVVARSADAITVAFANTTVEHVDTVPTDADNLAVRAAILLAEHTGTSAGAHLTIDKRIPVAGGMAGGSADAAATLVACDALWRTQCTRHELLDLAGELGADVPFALAGGTAIGVGRGASLTPVLAVATFHWVLVQPDLLLPTPTVYREFDRLTPEPGVPEIDPALLHALRTGDAEALSECLSNDLQDAAISLEPSIARTLEQADRAGGLRAIVSGSGATVAVLARDNESAIQLQVNLSAAGFHAIRARGPVGGARLVEG